MDEHDIDFNSRTWAAVCAVLEREVRKHTATTVSGDGPALYRAQGAVKALENLKSLGDKRTHDLKPRLDFVRS